MRDIIKKISVLAIAVMLLTTMFNIGSRQNVYADDDVTLNFIYSRDDGNYGNYTITVTTMSDSGAPNEFTVNNNVGTYSYTCSRENELVSFIVESKETPNTEIDHLRSVNIFNLSTSEANVEIKGNTEDFTITEVTASAGNENPTTENVTTSQSAEVTQAATQVKSDDPDKDYSVGTVKAIIIDVVLFAILGFSSYTILGKEKKPKI